jgi:hypothetical protein
VASREFGRPGVSFLLDELPWHFHLADEQRTKVQAIANKGRRAALEATLAPQPADAKGLSTLRLGRP